MITIIHGNDLENSRNYLYSLKTKLKNHILIEGEGISFNDFFINSQSKTLLNETPTIVIENFFSKNKITQNDVKKIIDYINLNNKHLELIFWDPVELTKTTQQTIKNADLKLFSFPKNIFLFLDNIKPGNSKYLLSLLNTLRKTTQDEIIFFMIVRQFRLMLSQVNQYGKKIDESLRLAHWQESKIKKQSSYFDDTLKLKYLSLFEIESGQKIGKFPYSLSKSIDFFLASL